MELGEYAGPLPYREWLTELALADPCCAQSAMDDNGCSENCWHADSDLGYWIWHGAAGDHPSPESVLNYAPLRGPILRRQCRGCGTEWTTYSIRAEYVDRVHAMMRGELLPKDFDEETERARLVAVER